MTNTEMGEWRLSTHRWLGVVALVCALTSCTRDNPAYNPNPALPDECRSGVEVTETFTMFARPTKLDILYVVDASGDTPAALQELFANSVAPIGGVLRALDVDARSAVITTDATVEGLAGPGKIGPSCEANTELVATLGSEQWASTLRCNLFAAPSANQYDQPLLAVQNLLENPPDDFLREDARLLVIVGMRSDDCSAAGPLTGPPRQACAQADLLGIKALIDAWGETRSLADTALVAFAGPPSAVAGEEARPVCSSTVGSAMAGNRLFDATRLFDYGRFHSVCTDDLFWPLADSIEAFVTQSPLTLCPGELTQEPLAVRVDGEPVVLGDDGFAFLGATEACPGGALRFGAPAVAAAEEIELTYCVAE